VKREFGACCYEDKERVAHLGLQQWKTLLRCRCDRGGMCSRCRVQAGHLEHHFPLDGLNLPASGVLQMVDAVDGDSNHAPAPVAANACGCRRRVNIARGSH
jgi:hypothetical protein